MAAPEFSTKRIAIDKANATLLIAIAAAVFVVVFSLVASKALLDQRAYQSRVIDKKELARDTLKANIAAVDTLNSSYQEFASANENVLGGNPSGKGDRDGENARIILDALPSQYDFPALTTSIEKLLKDNNFKLLNIAGTDDEVAQSENTSAENPKPVEIPFSIEVEASQSRAKEMVKLFERSIRPIQFNKLELTNQSGQLQITLTGQTYFQPAKSLNVRSEVVK